MFNPSDALWADLEPVPQDDGPAPVVPIMYSQEFSQVHNYFRALMKKNEKSERALKMTSLILNLNPANYTAWHFRRQCLKALNSDLVAELKWCADLAVESPKNYQLWHHRREIVTLLNQPLDELKHIEVVLERENDAKNYHAWTHRHWVLKTFGQWEGELKYVDQLLTADVTNNSAWNHRFFVLKHTSAFSRECLEEELEYVRGQLAKNVNNASLWNYLIGLSKLPNLNHQKAEALATHTLQQHPDASLALMFLVELATNQRLYCDQLTCFNLLPCARHQAKAPNKAAALCSQLEAADPCRQAYWQLRGTELANP